MRRLAVLLVCVASATAFGETTPATEYRFDAVKHKVVVKSGDAESRVDAGRLAKSGDKVSTGWFSYALIASPTHSAKFEIFSSTDVVLASGAPGVILSLDRGHLRAIFDKITGNEPRVVQTPGALLAVRGTKYDVNVDSEGRTTLDVIEGTVELRSQLRPEPLLIHAGEQATYGRREPPVMRPSPQGDHGRGIDGRNEGHEGAREGHEGSHPEGPEANEPHGHGGGPGDTHGAPPQGQPTQPPPPPHRPPTD